jgi:predicted 3-demethylubiquinone-9 3-methyltransferase (glyoxalase superfamily)
MSIPELSRSTSEQETRARLGPKRDKENCLMSSKIAPCLWFNGDAEAAAKLYTSLFPDSRITSVMRSPADNPSTSEGAVLTVEFNLAGQKFIGLNGGPEFQFSEAVSFTIDCADQAEVDRYWDALTADGGEPSQCGWLKDRFGVSWQVIPRQLQELLGGSDPDGARRAMEAMLQMSKIDVAALEEAYEGVPA